MKKLAAVLIAGTALLSGCVAYDPGYSAYPADPGYSAYPAYPAYSSYPVYPAYSGGIYTYSQPAYGGRAYRDRDRDGIPNRYDRDRDGDGVPNRADRYPNNPRRY
jgi:hypothetical protein